MRTRLLNYALYQSGWLACVLGAAHDRAWAGAAVAAALVAVHVLLAQDRAGELRLVVAAGLIGAVVDSVQVTSGLVTFRAGHAFAWMAPPWIVVMWMQFATLFRFCLSWLSGRYLLGAALGLVGGPLAFWAGERLGAATFHPPRMLAYGVLAVVWAGAVPVLTRLSDRARVHPGTGRYRGV